MSGILEDGRVYRIFGTFPEFGKFLRGYWKGDGMHGLPGFSSDLSPVVRTLTGSRFTRILLRGNQGKSFHLKFSDSSCERFPDTFLICPLDRWQVDTDRSSFEDEYYRMEVHAMKDDEIYFLLEKLKPARRILFAGVLKKRNIFSKLISNIIFIYPEFFRGNSGRKKHETHKGHRTFH